MATPTAVNGVCSLMPTSVPEHCCNWCAGPLTGRQRRWCSQRCHDEYFDAHDWKAARRIRLEMDKYICRSCGVRTIPMDSSVWFQHPERPTLPEFNRVDYKVGGEVYRAQWRQEDHDARKAIDHWMRTYALPLSPEVNHRDPRVGEGYGFGCWNHQENLETLCHRCHSKVTKMQRHERIMRMADG